MVLDLFAGPGGWDEGVRPLGLSPIGLEWDRDACRTRAAAGHRTIRTDVSAYPTAPFVGRVSGLIASPPCQAFSMAGKRLGMENMGRIHSAVEAARSGWRDEFRAGPWADPRSALILEPLRWAWTLRPEWIACEQVPPALPVWEHMADVLRSWGYSAHAVRLLASDYGVPQTRLRAFLLASCVGPVRVPEPTHAKLPTLDLFGTEPEAWQSMAAALGWEPGELALDRRVGGYAADAAPIGDDRPAPTLSLSHGREVFVKTGKNQEDGGGVRSPYYRSAERPSPVVDAASRSWTLRAGTNEHDVARRPDEPAPTLRFGARLNDVSWVNERPATSVQGDPRIGRPGHKDRDSGESQFEEGALRITLGEAAVLQSFHADYPFHGTKTAQFRQVGDAVPPLLARAVVGALIARSEIQQGHEKEGR